MTSPDPTTSVVQEMWGINFGSAPPGAPPQAANDAIVLCDGADPADFAWAKELGGGKTGWGWSWDLRGAILPFIHDLFRWVRPTNYAGGDVTKTWGARDEISHTHLLAAQNNWMLRKLCAQATPPISLTGMPGE